MNRIHAVAKEPDGIFALNAPAAETLPPLHLCPVNGRIVPCMDQCPDCAHLSDVYNARYHAHLADQVFGAQTRIDAGIARDLNRNVLTWLLDRTEGWTCAQAWAAILGAVGAFWAVVYFVFSRVG